MIKRISATALLLAILVACGGSGGSAGGSGQDNESVDENNSDTESDNTGLEGSNNTGTETAVTDAEDPNNTGENNTVPQVETETEPEPTDTPPIEVPDSPPFDGTIFLDPDIITPADPSAFQSITAQGVAERLMYDRREGWITTTPFLFQANYDDGLSIEIQINPEFTEADATAEAERYAWLFGQLPTLLRKDVDTSWIHRGVNPWGGGNRNLLVHTGQAALYFADGIAEETLIHEGSHTSLDADYAAAPGWLDAQQADPTFISTYARDNPNREDIAESFLPYVALRYRRDRISDDLAGIFEVTMPNRIQFFDSVVRDMYPLE